MARVSEVIMIEVPEVPARRKRKETRSSVLEKKKTALANAPRGLIVDSVYEGGGSPAKAEQSARNAAYQVNAGERKEWPAESFYGVYRESPEANEAGVWQLAIGLREHMHPDWAEFVGRAGSRKRKKAEEGEATDAVPSDPFEDDDEENQAA